MARRFPLPGLGPPTPINQSFAELGAENRRRLAKVKARGKKRAARFQGGNIDEAGERIKAHLDKNTDATWRLDIGTPRRVWDRRFVYKPLSRTVDWNDFQAAYEAIDSDARIDKLMSRRSVSALIYVYDPEEGDVVIFTVAAYGNWRNAMFDMARKVNSSATRYGAQATEETGTEETEGDEDEIHRIVQFTLLVGPREKK